MDADDKTATAAGVSGADVDAPLVYGPILHAAVSPMPLAPRSTIAVAPSINIPEQALFALFRDVPLSYARISKHCETHAMRLTTDHYARCIGEQKKRMFDGEERTSAQKTADTELRQLFLYAVQFSEGFAVTRSMVVAATELGYLEKTAALLATALEEQSAGLRRCVARAAAGPPPSAIGTLSLSPVAAAPLAVAAAPTAEAPPNIEPTRSRRRGRVDVATEDERIDDVGVGDAVGGGTAGATASSFSCAWCCRSQRQAYAAQNGDIVGSCVIA